MDTKKNIAEYLASVFEPEERGLYKIKENAFELVDAECEWCGAKCKKEKIVYYALCDLCQAKCDTFWREFHARKFNVLPDVPTMLELHKCVIKIGKKNPERARLIGTLLIGKHYGGDVWSSRSKSGEIAELFGGDYMMFYCGGSTYVDIYLSPLNLRARTQQLIRDFEKADKKDREKVK
jgi:hypothetical protein